MKKRQMISTRLYSPSEEKEEELTRDESSEGIARETDGLLIEKAHSVLLDVNSGRVRRMLAIVPSPAFTRPRRLGLLLSCASLIRRRRRDSITFSLALFKRFRSGTNTRLICQTSLVFSARHRVAGS